MIAPLTGRKVLVIGATLFTLVFAPNIILAVYAVQTFSGLVVPNSYVASQEFDARREAQEALGWTVALDHTPAALHVAITDAGGRPVRPAALAVTVGRPATAGDVRVDLLPSRTGYTGAVALAPGVWRVDIEAEAADGTAFVQRQRFFVAPS
jgi:nitrogen fixation protein FixH